MKQKLIFLAVICLSFNALVGCEDEELSAIAEAQSCLDSIPIDIDQTEDDKGLSRGTIWQKAVDCADPIEKYDSQQASIIKCGAYLTGGGIDTSRILDAAQALNDGGSNSESIYLAALTLNRPDETEANTTLAQQAQSACNKTKLDAYIFLGNMAATGTALSAAFGGAGIPNLDDPSSIDPADIDQAINDCVGDSACEETIAEAAVEIADTYCGSSAGQDDEVCSDIQDAIDSAGGDTSILTESLLCLLDGQPENCVP
ncbi:MAG: hypothetical protein HRT45_11990 [Bdellovibrionales bacterium]|nr:hypothetical protein [Bdellovibrionales bacterium]